MDKRIYDNYVIQISKYGSMTKAAAALGITQPALSSGITTLEKELGFTIFDRRRNPIIFTREGKLYYDFINRIQVLTEDFKSQIKDINNERERSFMIGGPAAYIDSVVADATGEYLSKYPDSHISIRTGSLSALIEMATRGEINCFISTSDQMPKNFNKRLIMHERIYLLVSRSNPINEKLKEYEIDNLTTTRKNFDYSLLNGEEFIFLEKTQPLQRQMEEFFRAYSIEAKNRIVVNQVSTALNMVNKVGGICFASESSLRTRESLDSYCVYSLPESVIGRNIYVAYDCERIMPEGCTDFIKILCK